MKILDVRIANWTGVEFWDNAEKHPDESRIKAVIAFELSMNEYRALLNSQTLAPNATLDPE